DGRPSGVLPMKIALQYANKRDGCTMVPISRSKRKFRLNRANNEGMVKRTDKSHRERDQHILGKLAPAGWDSVALALLACTAILVLAVPVFPTQDGPVHLYYVDILRDLLRHSG